MSRGRERDKWVKLGFTSHSQCDCVDKAEIYNQCPEWASGSQYVNYVGAAANRTLPQSRVCSWITAWILPCQQFGLASHLCLGSTIAKNPSHILWSQGKWKRSHLFTMAGSSWLWMIPCSTALATISTRTRDGGFNRNTEEQELMQDCTASRWWFHLLMEPVFT